MCGNFLKFKIKGKAIVVIGRNKEKGRDNK
jgi:hypothetical protein